ncbi:DNA-directed RNA polymerase, subunit P [Pyrobaculum islandicum DSM 4184]|uniref:DNA-directed RNA polymerase subunit Rpo12 n=1 Tax=Pyrobaculum islandicum (strain DSM 4184 / JCM 9189 / GEO3) TaxID=384616 RepID=A1RSZ3_PYRIL|nr:DNA-directed RNA polymerase, subunit P [Pyrobaculum islandicum DSM 4184]
MVVKNAVAEERKIYVCMRCGRVFSKSEMEILPGIRCPYCNFKIIMKVRSPMVKRIPAI